MMATGFDVISSLLLVSRGFFVIIGAVGVLRFPDFYTRTHAAGVTDTLGADLILVGLLFQVPDGLTAAKLGLIIVFFLLTSPVATHSVAHAAYAGREAPLTGRLLLRQNVPIAAEDDDESGSGEAA